MVRGRYACLLLALAGLEPLTGCLGRTHRPITKVSAAPTRNEVEVSKSTVTGQAVEIESSAGLLRVTTPRADTFRIQLLRSRSARQLPSYAIEPQALGALPLHVDESDTLLLVRTSDALLRIDKKPLRLRLMDSAGSLIDDDVARAVWTERGASLEFGLSESEHVYGLGDKVRGFDRRGQSFELWNTDAYGWKVDSDPLYKSIPFFLFLKEGRAHGLFVDYPGRARVDVGAKVPDRLSFAAETADTLDAYLFASREPKRVLEAYTSLTGRTPLPPRWALGHHQSRYGYLTEQDVRGVVARLQQDKVPLDAVWLDIDFQAGNAPFTVNSQAFPGFAKMVAEFQARGVETVVITDLHVKSYQGKPSAGYAPYDSGAAGDQFIRDAKGFFEGKVWPGASVFPEFTRETTRAWWGALYQGFVEQGVAGFWNDMNEPALFDASKTFPDSLEHRLDDGSKVAHALLHNAYGSLNARATYEGVRRLRPDVRPFILTRAAYAGVQKYAASWTGDNTADRSHLAVTIPQLANLGVSGYPFNGADVGGFIGCPDAELFAEWMELGALQPFFRNHSAKESCRREPWLFGTAVEARVRRAVERRYRLLPYLYTVFEEASRTGLPVLRPLWLEYPNDPSTYSNATAYLLGEDLLVAPRLQAGVKRYTVTLPGGDWYEIESGRQLGAGSHEVEAPPDDSVRLFVRAGAIVPEQPILPNSAKAPVGALTLEVWPASDCRGSLYVDDGKSFAYQTGDFRRIQYECERSETGFSVAATSTGAYAPWWGQTRLELHDVAKAPLAVKDAAGNALPHLFDSARRTLVVTLPGNPEFRVNASW